MTFLAKKERLCALLLSPQPLSRACVFSPHNAAARLHSPVVVPSSSYQHAPRTHHTRTHTHKAMAPPRTTRSSAATAASSDPKVAAEETENACPNHATKDDSAKVRGGALKKKASKIPRTQEPRQPHPTTYTPLVFSGLALSLSLFECCFCRERRGLRVARCSRVVRRSTFRLFRLWLTRSSVFPPFFVSPLLPCFFFFPPVVAATPTFFQTFFIPFHRSRTT